METMQKRAVRNRRSLSTQVTGSKLARAENAPEIISDLPSAVSSEMENEG
jgi:hypothetical protein